MLSLLAFALIACEPPPPPTPGEVERTGEVIKVVNGKNVTQGMVDAQLEQLPAETRDQIVARGQMDRVKDNVVIGELLYQEALKQKLQDDPKVKSAIALAERGALASALIDKTVEARMTDDAIKKWYDDHAVQFARPQAKARHILFDKKDKAEAEKVLAELKADRSKFAEIATAKSIDKGSAKEGGELGWFDKNRMVPEFADAVFAGNKGDLLGLVETKYGFHIVEVEDKRDSVPVDEVKDKIKGQLRNDLVEAYIDELKKGATITDAAGAAPAGGATVSAPAGGAAPATPAPADGAAPAAGK
jgi:peptidyl-prolyl cis-trans isomerase C